MFNSPAFLYCDKYFFITLFSFKALFVAPEPKIGGICHQQALDNMELAALELQRNDFAVVDVVLESKAVLEMSNALLTSTIWYDMTKGNTFAAHPDDGLVHSVFKECTQEIAMAMSASAGRPFKVDSYYALAVDLSTKGTGPLSMGENGEIVVALWINPSNPPPSVRVIYIYHRRCQYHLYLRCHRGLTSLDVNDFAGWHHE